MKLRNYLCAIAGALVSLSMPVSAAPCDEATIRALIAKAYERYNLRVAALKNLEAQVRTDTEALLAALRVATVIEPCEASLSTPYRDILSDVVNRIGSVATIEKALVSRTSATAMTIAYAPETATIIGVRPSGSPIGSQFQIRPDLALRNQITTTNSVLVVPKKNLEDLIDRVGRAKSAAEREKIVGEFSRTLQ